jgi:hypothetical protein
MLRFESLETEFSPELIRSGVLRFDASRFASEMSEFIDDCLADHYVFARNPVVPSVPKPVS